MSALNFKPPQLLGAALVGIGALWFMSQRRAGATGIPGYGRSPLAPSSGVAAANARFFLSPARANPATQQAAPQPMQAQANTGLAGLAARLLGKTTTVGTLGGVRGDWGPVPTYGNPDESWRNQGNGLPPGTAVSDDAVVANGPGLQDPMTNLPPGDWGPAPAY